VLSGPVQQFNTARLARFDEWLAVKWTKTHRQVLMDAEMHAISDTRATDTKHLGFPLQWNLLCHRPVNVADEVQSTFTKDHRKNRGVDDVPQPFFRAYKVHRRWGIEGPAAITPASV